jgi:hypothetical protein
MFVVVLCLGGNVKNLYRLLLTVFLVFLVSGSFVGSLSAQNSDVSQSMTLADTINAVLSDVKVSDSSWNVIYDQIFCRQDVTVFDSAIVQALNSADYKEVIFIARLAELNDYTSQTITNSVRVALEVMPMVGSLSVTYTGREAPESFVVYDRYMVHAYRYAQDLGVTRWDINAAFNDFAKAYDAPPSGSVSGEMLWINPQQEYARSFSSRYYDEHAETLGMFLFFALNGVDDAIPYADDAWLNLQDHWTGNIYGYTGNTTIVECEMGNFAQIITQYQQNSKNNIPTTTE